MNWTGLFCARVERLKKLSVSLLSERINKPHALWKGLKWKVAHRAGKEF